MSIPFYVSPEQLMKDRADFARKGIARGRGLVVVQYADGIAFVSENLHRTLHKISELYDRIAFAAVGRYNEYENLRIAGVRLADMRGYSYDRRDVTGRGLANAYAQTLGTIFSSGAEKPYEVEIFVAEVGDAQTEDQIYRLTYQGSVADEHGHAVMGGSTERVEAYLSEHFREGLDLDAAVRLGVTALGHDTEATRTIPASEVEAAVLERSRGQQRKFRRLSVADVQQALDSGEPEPLASEKAEPATSETKGEPSAGEGDAGEADTGEAEGGTGEGGTGEGSTGEGSTAEGGTGEGGTGEGGTGASASDPAPE